jgi:hypothetical protein
VGIAAVAFDATCFLSYVVNVDCFYTALNECLTGSLLGHNSESLAVEW